MNILNYQNSKDKEQNRGITGFASIDRPWLKYYQDNPENVKILEVNLYQFIYDNNKDNLDDIALNYYHNKITYRELFKKS